MMQKSSSFRLGTGLESSSSARYGAPSPGSAFGVSGRGGEVSGTTSTSIPGFLFSGTQTSVVVDIGHEGGSGGLVSSGKNMGGCVAE